MFAKVSHVHRKTSQCTWPWPWARRCGPAVISPRPPCGLGPRISPPPASGLGGGPALQPRRLDCRRPLRYVCHVGRGPAKLKLQLPDAGLTAAQQLHAGAALPAAVEVREVRHRDGARARAGRDPHVADVCARWRERRGDAMELMNACREDRGTKNGNERR